jgi:hypothetical protein
MLSRYAVLAAATLVLAGLARPSAQKAIPRTPDGRPNLQGIWQAQRSGNDDVGRLLEAGGSIPYLPAAANERAKNFASRATADPFSKCNMPGVPRIMYIEWPFQILQEKDHVAMLFEWMLDYRLIYTNGSPHETRVNPWMGDSRGRWDGDTLVVDVANHSEHTWFDKAGDFHSDALHVVERYTMLDPDTIRYEATIEDPKVFARPWTISVPLGRQRGVERVGEFNCQAVKEEANGDFERDARTWYPGPNAKLPEPAFAPPAEQHRPSQAPASVPRTADGKPDLNGLYEADGGGANYGLEAHPPSPGSLTPPGRGVVVDPGPDGNPPFQPWAREEREARNTPMRGYDDPTAHCFPAGVPRALYVPTPFHIVQTPDAVATLHERMQWRLISLNRSRHLADGVRLWQGDSIGHWDGDTLVVETTNFNGRTWGSEVGDVFSHAEHVIERFTPLDRNAIRYEATISDPLVYTRPFTIAVPLKRIPGELFEAACHEEEHDLPVLKRIRDQERAKLKK